MADARLRLEFDGPSPRSPTTTSRSTTCSTTTWTSACSRSSASCRSGPRCGRSSGGARASRSRRAVTSASIGGGQVPMSHHELMTPGPPGHPADLRPRRPDHRRLPGLVDRRLVPAGAAVRHPDRGRRRPVHAARGRPRRDPRHRRRGPPVPDVRSRGGQRPGAHRPAHERRRGARARRSCRGSCRATSSTPPCARWPRRSRRRRRSP